MTDALLKKIFVGLTLSLPVWAGGLKAPIDFPSANVLPKGVRNIRFKGVLLEAQEKFNGSGSVVPLGDSLNTNVSWNQLVEGKDTPTEEAVTEGFVQNFLNENGFGQLNDTAGRTTGVANVAVGVQVPVIAVGVTNKLTMAVAVPIIKTKVNVDTSFMANNSLVALQEKLFQDGLTSQSKDLATKLLNPIAKKLNDYNYEPLQDEEQTNIGDIKFVTKYNLSKRKRLTYTLQADLVLPTGKTAELNKALNIPSGDGQVDIGGALLTSFQLNNNFTLNNSTGYLRQLPTNRAMRVPEKSSSKLTPDIDNDVRIDLGDMYYTNLGVDYNFWNGFVAQTAYGLQYKQKDSYKGAVYTEERYRWMEQDTRMNMQTVQLGIGYNTLKLFRQGKFKVPLGASLNQTWVMAGKNVTKDPLTSFDLYMFF